MRIAALFADFLNMNSYLEVHDNPGPIQAPTKPMGLDPKRTEDYLLSQRDVLDASAWYSDGRLHASVTLSEWAEWTVAALKRACCEDLGLHCTPADVLMLRAKNRAA